MRDWHVRWMYRDGIAHLKRVTDVTGHANPHQFDEEDMHRQRTAERIGGHYCDRVVQAESEAGAVNAWADAMESGGLDVVC